jgi:imidazolonepropionase-like amidohydrolase
LLLATHATAQGLVHAPDRSEGEGAGPFGKLVIVGGILIDGTGAPPRGPVTITIDQNRIASIEDGTRAPRDAEHLIDANGMYILPGFLDMHAHLGDPRKAPEAEYCYKLWLGHGVTTVRGVGLADNDFTLIEKDRSAKNEIVAPRIFNYQRPGNPRTAEEARQWVREAPGKGIDGLKLGAYPPEIMRALCEEAAAQGLGTTAHLAQIGVAQMNAIDAARAGLDTVTHFYGHFESLLKDHVIQPWPADMNYNDEQMRFGQVARLWDQIHPPGSPEWRAYLEEHLKLGTVFDPTMTIYSANRDVMRARNADWHAEYTLPSLWEFFEPDRRTHGSYWFDWTTHDEVAWRNFYHVWMQLINDYKKMGGRVTTGSDSGFIYQTYGFGYVLELELLQEAGLHPLEVIQAATMNGALTLHEPKKQPLEFGIVREGLLADLVIVAENPLHNLKVLYGTGAVRLNEETGEPERTGGIAWTIKDGIVYDAKQLLADVRAMVQRAKEAANAPPADVTGAWDLSAEFVIGSMSAVVEIVRAEDGTLSGTWTRDGVATALENFRVEGERVRYELEPTGSSRITFDGRVTAEGAIEGTLRGDFGEVKARMQRR